MPTHLRRQLQCNRSVLLREIDDAVGRRRFLEIHSTGSREEGSVDVVDSEK